MDELYDGYPAAHIPSATELEDDLRAEHEEVELRALELTSAARPNRLLPVLDVLAGDIAWPAALDANGLLTLRAATADLAEAVHRTARKRNSGALRTLGWYLDGGEHARTVLTAAGVTAVGASTANTTTRILLETLTAVLAWRQAQASSPEGAMFHGDLGATATRHALAAARWSELARAAGTLLVADLKAVMDVALPPGWACPTTRTKADGQTLCTSRAHAGAGRDVITATVTHQGHTTVAIERRTSQGETIVTVEPTVTELCLLAARAHRLVVGPQAAQSPQEDR